MSPTARRFFGCGLPFVLAVGALATCGLLFFSSRVVVHMVTMPDDGMAPLLEQGDEVFTTNTLIWSSEPLRGMVACLDRPEGFTFRRIVALPGDRVAVAGGIVLVDGVPHDPARNKRGTGPDQPEITLAAGQYFVVADDRDAADSRQWGTIERGDLVGEPQYYNRSGVGNRILLGRTGGTGIDRDWLVGPEQAKRSAAATATADAERRP
ncbi:MAG: signal peptidase I [Ardenticatenales bacterium]|nr:signal peptidase I [Ardenticatenales bacterium]